MPSRNVGTKRKRTPDAEIPAELAQREAQDRASARSSGRSTSEQARSPIDAMHVDAPKRQDNARGHRRKKRS